MQTQQVRVSLEVTWDPTDGHYSIARREWRRNAEGTWELEGMACSGTPLNLHDVLARLEHAQRRLRNDMLDEIGPFHTGYPFGE